MKKIIYSVLLFLITLSGLLYSWESYIDSGRKDSRTGMKSYHFRQYGIDIGFFPRASADLDSTLTYQNKIIYKVRYQTDRFNLRIPVIENQSAAHMIFAGCSFIFGEGLPVEESLPYLIGKADPAIKIVNLSSIGGGLHSLLRWAELFSLKDLSLPENGVFIYFFLPDHIDRLLSRVNYLMWADPGAPHFELRNGQFIYTGPVKETKNYKIVRNTSDIGLNNLVLKADTPAYTREDLKNFITGIRQLRKRVNQQLPLSKFHVAFYPFQRMTPELENIFRSELGASGINVFDTKERFLELMKLRGLTEENLSIPHDGHPNLLHNQILTEVLSHML